MPRILSRHTRGITRKTELLEAPAFRGGRQPRSVPFPGVTPAGSILSRSLSMVLTRRRQRALLRRPCRWPCAPLRAERPAAAAGPGACHPSAALPSTPLIFFVVGIIVITIDTIFFFFKFSTLEGGGVDSEDLPFLGFIC